MSLITGRVNLIALGEDVCAVSIPSRASRATLVLKAAVCLLRIAILSRV